MLAWDAARAQWSDPWALDLRLRQPNTERWLAWDELRVLQAPLPQAQDSLVVLGTDASTGDVWLTQAPLTAIDLAYAAPSPWSQPEAPAEWSAAATADADGRGPGGGRRRDRPRRLDLGSRPGPLPPRSTMPAGTASVGRVPPR